MIRTALYDAEISTYESGGGGLPPRPTWIVTHPSNDAILAYCDTEAEAIAFRQELNELHERMGRDQGTPEQEARRWADQELGDG